MATRLELEQEAGRRAAAKRSVVAMAAVPVPDVIVSDLPMPVDAVVEELVRQEAPKKRTRTRAKPKAEVEPAPEAAPEVAPVIVDDLVDFDDIDALLDT